jgi:hypothetical protein
MAPAALVRAVLALIAPVDRMRWNGFVRICLPSVAFVPALEKFSRRRRAQLQMRTKRRKRLAKPHSCGDTGSQWCPSTLVDELCPIKWRHGSIPDSQLVEGCTRECGLQIAHFSIFGERVARVFNNLKEERGLPASPDIALEFCCDQKR